jgi:hypothetical protein
MHRNSRGIGLPKGAHGDTEMSDDLIEKQNP